MNPTEVLGQFNYNSQTQKCEPWNTLLLKTKELLYSCITPQRESPRREQL